MGDINARIGNPQNSTEEEFMGKYGEETRNKAGTEAINFMIKTDLTCLNNRQKQKPTQHTYHMRGDEIKSSIIDVICTSRNMFREEYKAEVLPITLTGSESHFPVVADIKITRNKFRIKKPIPRQIWNLKNLSDPEKLVDFIILRDQNIKKWRAKDIESTLTSAENFTECILNSASEIVKKICVRQRFHKSRNEKKYERLRTQINKYKVKTRE